jgi:predicted negative regulator of RcsB-dependent stress response
MAQQLDLQEQEQVDALKAFWAKYGNLIVWTATIVLAAFAGWNFWLKHERDLSAQASTLYGEMEAAAQAGDAARAATIFGDMKARVPKTTYAQQGGLLAAKVESDKGKPADAMAALQWVADNGNEENAAVARLRLAGLLADAKKSDEALKQLEQVKPASFVPLVADRRGDILLAKGDKDGARTAYKAAFDGLPATQQYRFVIEAKLTALGAAPAVSAASAAASAGQAGAAE